MRFIPKAGRYTHLILFAAFTFFYLNNLFRIQREYNRLDMVINEDAFGYYVILPALFRYNDPEFVFLDSTLRRMPAFAAYIPPVVNTLSSGEKVCKYYSGVALMQSPFYFAAAWLNDGKEYSGFEPEFQRAVLYSSAFWFLSGMLMLVIMLGNMGVPPLAAGAAPFVVLFGTNLYMYATFDPGYSHVYSFFAIVGFMATVRAWGKDPNTGRAILAGFLLGLVVLIRPLNGIVLLIVPVILGYKGMQEMLNLHQLKRIAAAGIAFAAVVSLQSVLWYIQTGDFFVYPYGEEKLDLLHPRVFELIFSYDCGWAVYTPLPFLVLCLSLLTLFLRKEYFRGFFALLSAYAVLYLLSSWYYLHYGCTAGCRPVTEYYGPLMLLAGYSFKPLLKKRLAPLFFTAFSGLFIWHNMIVQKQFLHHILNWCDMDKKRYWMVFLKTHEAYRYSTSKLWDFSRFDGTAPVYRVRMNKRLSTGAGKERDTMKLVLPELRCADSSLLLTFHLKGKMNGSVNESFLRFLTTDDGNYRELLRVMLMRYADEADRDAVFSYQYHLNGDLLKGKVEISLESPEGDASSEVQVTEMDVRRIRY